MRGNRLHVDETKKERQRPAALAKGGDRPTFKAQQANPDKAGSSGKPDVRGPGAKSAKGGGRTPANLGGVARPAKAGATVPG
jgi:hypothetical protein